MSAISEWLVVVDYLSDEWWVGTQTDPVVIYREGTRERLSAELIRPPGEPAKWEITGPGNRSIRTGYTDPGLIASEIERRLLPKVRAYLAENP
jgi:hypothetical protein